MKVTINSKEYKEYWDKWTDFENFKVSSNNWIPREISSHAVFRYTDNMRENFDDLDTLIVITKDKKGIVRVFADSPHKIYPEDVENIILQGIPNPGQTVLEHPSLHIFHNFIEET